MCSTMCPKMRRTHIQTKIKGFFYSKASLETFGQKKILYGLLLIIELKHIQTKIEGF